jgi:uncharacterized protein (TIGR03435 family)
VPDGEGEPSIKQWKSMVKKLMADRFQLKFHFEKREQSVYMLTVARTGPMLTRSESDPIASGGWDLDHLETLARPTKRWRILPMRWDKAF